MLPNLPIYVPITFALTVLVTLLLFYRAMTQANTEITRQKATPIMIGLLVWLAIQAVLTLNGMYKSAPAAGPPRIVLFGVLPVLLTIVSVFATSAGRRFADSLPLVNLTWLNTVRVVVELVLYWLFLYEAVPELRYFVWHHGTIRGALRPDQTQIKTGGTTDLEYCLSRFAADHYRHCVPIGTHAVAAFRL